MPFLTRQRVNGRYRLSFYPCEDNTDDHESRTVYLNTAIEALLKAEAALNDLALAYELKPDERQAHAIPEPAHFPLRPR